MANRIKVAAKPCPDGKHEFNGYNGGGHCDTPLCGWWSEYHCRKCGWFISKCRCGDWDGENPTSYRQEMAIDKRMEQKRKERGQ